MNEREAWHARIEEAPDDLELRQVFGDWLLAQGDPHGALIQLECKALRAPDDPQYRSWRRAAGKLRRDYEATWEKGLQLEIRGGLVEAARISLWHTRGTGHLDALLARGAALTRIRIDNRAAGEAEVRAIAVHPLWARARSIEGWASAMTAILGVVEAQPLPRLA